MYKQSKTIRNLLYFSKFNKNKTIFYHLRVALVPLLLMMVFPHMYELLEKIQWPCTKAGEGAGGREVLQSAFY